MDHITLREDTQKKPEPGREKTLFSMKGTKEPLRSRGGGYLDRSGSTTKKK